MALPITTQPGAVDPRGMVGGSLDALRFMEEIVVEQKVELLEVFTNCEMANKYEIKSPSGALMFKAKEDANCCKRAFCGPARSFEMNLTDPQGNVVIVLERPFRCCAMLCCCCGMDFTNQINIYSPPGRLVGAVHEIWTPCVPKYSIADAGGNSVLQIVGKCCPCSCPCVAKCRDVPFQILSTQTNTQVGVIKKIWSGYGREFFTDADTFAVKFPLDMAVETKATLLGAAILIDFMYFEEPAGRNNDHNSQN